MTMFNKQLTEFLKIWQPAHSHELVRADSSISLGKNNLEEVLCPAKKGANAGIHGSNARVEERLTSSCSLVPKCLPMARETVILKEEWVVLNNFLSFKSWYPWLRVSFICRYRMLQLDEACQQAGRLWEQSDIVRRHWSDCQLSLCHVHC